MKKFLLFIIILICLVTVGCATDSEIAKVTAEYTNEVAQAVAAAGWKIAGAIFGGLIVHAVVS